MLDKLEQTTHLIATLKDAVPFPVAPTPEVITSLARDEDPLQMRPIETVIDVSYLGDPGGIMCHIHLAGTDSAVVLSLTHVRVARNLPFAKAVIDYQRHRVKKIKKQLSRGW